MPYAAEIAGRLVLVAFTIHFLPKVFYGDITHFWRLAGRMSWHRLPYSSVRYEFPPLTLPFLALAKLPGMTYFWYRWVFGIVMVAFEYGSLCVLRRAWPDLGHRLNVMWSLAVLPVALLGWFRFDLAAVLFATLGLVALEKGTRGGATSAVVGFGLKLWPIVLVPAFLLRRQVRTAAVALAGCAALVVAWWAFSPPGFRAFLKFREGTGLEVESVPASVRLLGHHGRFVVRSGAWVIDPGGFTWVNAVFTVLLVVFSVSLIWAAARRPSPDLVALAGALTLASFLLSRIISAQYIVWLGPFVALLWARGHRLVGWLGAAVSISTWGFLFEFKRGLLRGSRWVADLVLLRNLLLIALLVEFTRLVLVDRKAAAEVRSEHTFAH